MLTEISPVTLNKWSDFAKSHPNGNIFQSPLMYEIYRKSRFYKPIPIISMDHVGNINGVLLAVILKEGTGFKGHFSRRSLVLSGPLIIDNSETILEFLLQEYLTYIKHQAIYTQFRNSFDWGSLKEIFIQKGFVYEDHLDIIHNLNLEENEMWKKLEYSKRKNINNAIKKGIDIKIVDLNIELDIVYYILKDVYNKAKLPLFDLNFFTLTHYKLSEELVCIGAYLKDKLIGIRLILCYKNLVYDWYGGSLNDYLQYRPNDILSWEVLKWAKSNGYEYFDFGGAGKPGITYGVRDYKLKFGGDLRNFGRFEKIHNLPLMKLGKAAFHLYKILYGLYFNIIKRKISVIFRKN